MKIYCITNTVNGKRYVGSAHDLRGRWRHHLWSLRGGCHHNPHLQHAFLKYGELAFSLSVLEDGIIDNAVV